MAEAAASGGRAAAPGAESASPAPPAGGADRIAAAFAAARERGSAALMPYMMGGFPDHDTAGRIAGAYADSGADLIELGVPFSDPLADGPVIHDAGTKALAAGATFESVLETCAAVSDRVPVVVMAYANMALAAGVPHFADDLVSAGAAGAIIPDLPLDEAELVRATFDERRLALVPLVAPSTGPGRREDICTAARGFVYLVSLLGVTGERTELPPELARLVRSVKEDSDLPVAVGFGISTPEQATAVGRDADGVIIGSRLVKAVGEADGPDAAVAAVTEFLTDTREALAGG